jgi:peptidyl-prolyl cis-trans isomerase A (cyclophilin A)
MRKLSFIASFVALLAGGSVLLAQKAPTNEKAPETYHVNFDLSTGPVVIEVTRSLAPIGADRFYNLVKAKYFDGARFFRVIPNFMAQFGLAADPKMSQAWDVNIQDDPVKTTNARGTLTFAATGAPNSRSEQLFINFADNKFLDGQRFAPFGKVISGMENVDKIYSGDRENPDQGRATAEGNAYLLKTFPKLDYIKTARIAP